jgi:hypothetical protein
MVRAILDGIKTQTRRVINPQPIGEFSRLIGPAMYAPIVIDRDGIEQPGKEVYGVYTEDGEWGVRCPYGMPGGRLWVKETFVKFDRSHWPPKYGYKADTLGPGFKEIEKARKDLGYKYTPSIFMPRATSRLDLDVLNIRVQRIQEISAEDALAEGIERPLSPNKQSFYELCLTRFMDLWDSINAKPRPRYVTENGKKKIAYYESFPWYEGRETKEYRGKPWYVYGNPWVWAVTFGVCDES